MTVEIELVLKINSINTQVVYRNRGNSGLLIYKSTFRKFF